MRGRGLENLVEEHESMEQFVGTICERWVVAD